MRQVSDSVKPRHLHYILGDGFGDGVGGVAKRCCVVCVGRDGSVGYEDACTVRDDGSGKQTFACLQLCDLYSLELKTQAAELDVRVSLEPADAKQRAVGKGQPKSPVQ